MRFTNRYSESVNSEHVGATSEENLRLMAVVVGRDGDQIVNRNWLDVELVSTGVVRSDRQRLHEVKTFSKSIWHLMQKDLHLRP